MKKKIACLAVAFVLLLSITGCGAAEDKTYYLSNAEKIAQYVLSDTTPVICYDNYAEAGLTQSYMAEADKSYTLNLAEGVTMGSVTAVDKDQKATDASRVVTVSGNTFTSVGAGTVKVQLNKDGASVGTLEIVSAPAYVTDPDNMYKKKASDYTQSSKHAGSCHDPSLIEVEENGVKTYYMFSTGWSYGNEMRKSTDLIHWEYIGKSTHAGTELKDIEAWETTSNRNGTLQWWAPDIVPAAGGGYWLYTCVVDGANGGVDATVGGEVGKYTKAAIVLFWSETLTPETFTYKGVLVQSCIPAAGQDLDVNAIDPQIIYTTDGRMYMAYGSFGTGNYILELDPQTGLRTEKVKELTNSANGERGSKNYKDWLTPDQVVNERDYVSNYLFSNYEDEDGYEIGWYTPYYGTAISRKNMEAPVIARHDGVVKYNEDGNAISEATTYYYSMHSMDGLDVAYAMWGGKSESVTGTYHGVTGSIVYNMANNNKGGNKYMGSFTWEDNAYSYDILLTGHNDLFTTSNGTHVAAFITRTDSYKDWGISNNRVFLTQIHQYTLNANGDICVNPNRYAGEVERTVSEAEMLAFADQGYFKLARLVMTGASTVTSQYVQLNADHTISGAYTGSWKVYGKNFIKIVLDGYDTYYGTVTCSWLDDQYCVGMSFTALGQKTGYSILANSVVDLDKTSVVKA